MLKDYSLEELSELAFMHFGAKGRFKELEGFTDRNFLLVDEERQQKFVLKISSFKENEVLLRIQNEVLRNIHLFDTKMNCKFPQLQLTLNGEQWIILEEKQNKNHIRLLKYIEGIEIWNISDPPLYLYEDTGKIVARFTYFLQDLTKKQYIQSLMHNLDLSDSYCDTFNFNLFYDKYCIALDEDLKDLVNQCKNKFNGEIMPIVEKMPKQIIHNDICLTNILVDYNESKELFLSGIIDFSCLIISYKIMELVVICARCNFYEKEPLRNMLIIIQNYRKERQLNQQELIILFPLIKIRLAFLCLESCFVSAESQGDPYVLKCKEGQVSSFKAISSAISDQGFLLLLKGQQIHKK